MLLTVNTDGDGKRLDTFVSELGVLSRSRAVKLIETGEITVNGVPVSKKHALKSGDTVEINVPKPEEYDVVPENIPIDVIYEDCDIAVINKPSGMVVHPAPGNYSGTLVNALLYRMKDSLSGIGGIVRPGIVHRIDKDTSGLLVIAKNDDAHANLCAQLERHGIVREYHALVKGGFKSEYGTVHAPIGRNPLDRKKMAVHASESEHAKDAVTHYEVIERFDGITYLKLLLETGRTHQIRVHMSHIGHSLIGDEVYGKANSRFEKAHAQLMDGQMLHAKRLSFIHPRTGENVEFECPIPDNFTRALTILRNEANK